MDTLSTAAHTEQLKIAMLKQLSKTIRATNPRQINGYCALLLVERWLFLCMVSVHNVNMKHTHKNAIHQKEGNKKYGPLPGHKVHLYAGYSYLKLSTRIKANVIRAFSIMNNGIFFCFHLQA